LFAADEDCALEDDAQWLKANPALGVFRDREDLVAAVRKAMRIAGGRAEGPQPVSQSAGVAECPADRPRRMVRLRR
jgi:hypothetical protein